LHVQRRREVTVASFLVEVQVLAVGLLVLLISYTYVYKQSKTQLYILVLANSSFRYLLLFHFDDIFQPVHLGHLPVYNCTNMLESTTVRNAY